MRNLPLACWMLGFLIAMLAPAPSLAQDTGAAVLDGVPALARKLDVDARDQTLGTLLARISAVVGTPIVAESRVADFKITLLCKETRAAEVLALVSAQQDLIWRKRGRTLCLTQSPGAAQRDAAAQQEYDAAVWDYLDELFKRRGNNPSSNAPAQEPPPPLPQIWKDPGPDLPPRERLAAYREWCMQIDAAQELTGRVARLFRELSPAQRMQVRTGVTLDLAADDPSLPSNTRKNVNELVLATLKQPSLPNDQGTAAAGAQRSTPVVRLNFVGIGFQPVSSPLCYRRSIKSLRVRLGLRRSGQIGVGVLFGSAWTHRVPIALPPDEFPEERRWSSDQRFIIGGLSLDGQPNSSVPLSTVLALIARAWDGPVVADSFTRIRCVKREHLFQRSLSDVIRRVQRAKGIEWQRRGSALVLKHVGRARERSLEIPPRLLKPLLTERLQSIPRTLDRLGAMLESVTSEQMLELHEFWEAYFAGSRIGLARQVRGPMDWQSDLRVWKALTPHLRRRLLAGEELTEWDLIGLARERWTAAARTPTSNWMGILVESRPFPTQPPGIRLGIRMTPRTVSAVSNIGLRSWLLAQPGECTELSSQPDEHRENVVDLEFIYRVPGDANPIRVSRMLLPDPRRPTVPVGSVDGPSVRISDPVRMKAPPTRAPILGLGL